MFKCETFRQCNYTNDEVCDLDNVYGVSCTSSGALSKTDVGIARLSDHKPSLFIDPLSRPLTHKITQTAPSDTPDPLNPPDLTISPL